MLFWVLVFSFMYLVSVDAKDRSYITITLVVLISHRLLREKSNQQAFFQHVRFEKFSTKFPPKMFIAEPCAYSGH